MAVGIGRAVRWLCGVGGGWGVAAHSLLVCAFPPFQCLGLFWRPFCLMFHRSSVVFL